MNYVIVGDGRETELLGGLPRKRRQIKHRFLLTPRPTRYLSISVHHRALSSSQPSRFLNISLSQYLFISLGETDSVRVVVLINLALVVLAVSSSVPSHCLLRCESGKTEVSRSWHGVELGETCGAPGGLMVPASGCAAVHIFTASAVLQYTRV